MAGNIVTIVESKIGPSTKKKQDLNLLLKFDEVYYKFYILLTDEAEEFDKYLQSQADGYIELPREIYNKSEECLSICRKLIKEKMSLSLSD